MSDEYDAECDDEDDDEILLSSSDSEADSDDDSESNKETTVEVKTEVTSETCDDVAASGDNIPADTDTSDVIDIDKLASIIIKDDIDDDSVNDEHVSTTARGSCFRYFSL